jgi:hypothetical protein
LPLAKEFFCAYHVLYFAEFPQPKARFVHERFAKRPLLRRIIALGAAYAIALSSLIASFSAVRAAVADTTSSDIVICQPTFLGHTTPTSLPAGFDSCVGCLVLLAAVPPPPTTAIALEQSPGQLLALPIILDLSSRSQTKSHRSRAPPQSA